MEGDGDSGHSINDDLRMMGESGDDHDDGGDLGLHDLVGSTAAAPIDPTAGHVPGGDGNGAAAGVANGMAAPSIAPRQHKTKSPAWEDIDPIYTTVGGKQATSFGGMSSGGMSSLETELTSYLDSDTLQKFDDDFNILDWWHEHKLTYPVLSILARDVIFVPVSTISSESAFSLCGRIIEERRRHLSPEMVEMLLCIKDWELGDARMQHTVEDNEMAAAYENQYLDVEPDAEAEP